ncbi:hypothetical protein VMCG_05848 [Cytospora schulzeri]|uniref:Myb-like domain-containing protein n=1 Tax=Cytospora schulzeri TaxID=448051 RepID=A0A423WDC5_9PEZI|nr:hypothetical protein VMCG_05848 [Valsa malicola]
MATNAIEHTLRYHLGPDAKLDTNDKTLVIDSIQETFPLRERARDIHVAHLEIACDAAVTLAETLNKTNPESKQINLRWFYSCVQSLLSIELKPELLQDGQVDRLFSRVQLLDNTSDPRPEAGSSSLGSSSEWEDYSSEDTSLDRSTTVDHEAPVPMKDPKRKWDDDELQQMIELKQSGLTHKAIAKRLGRTQSAVENKYGRLMSQRAAVSPSLKRRHGQEEEQADDTDVDDDDDKDNDNDDDKDDDEDERLGTSNKRVRRKV